MARKKGRRGRGEGGIEQLKSGSWRGEVRKTDPETGRVFRTRKTFKTKPEVLEWMKSAEPAAPGTLGEWVAAWLALHKAAVSAGAYRTDRQACDTHLSPAPLARVRLAALTPLQCRTFLASLTCSDSERHKAGRTLRMVCHAAAKLGLVPKSPMQGVRVPPPPRPDTHALTPAELGRVVLAADARGGPWPAFFRLAADAGLRPQELAGLRLADLDLAAGTVRVEWVVCRTSNQLKPPKTDAGRRTIDLSPATLAAVRTWLDARPPDRGGFLFPAKVGGHWRLRNLDQWGYKPVITASRVKMTPYTLRHTMATLLLRDRISPKVVSARLGHADVATTLRVYAHCIAGDQKVAASIMGRFLGGESDDARGVENDSAVPALPRE